MVPRRDAVAEQRSDSPPPQTVSPAQRRLTAAGEQPSPPRLHGHAWAIARTGTGDDLAFGQLGASQAGVRLTYAVDDGRRLALSLRASTPLHGLGREAAAGVDWLPSRLPVHLLVEQRLPLDGGPARPAAQLIAGGLVRLPLRLDAEAYGQAGAVLRRGGFADGAARVTRGLLARRGAHLDLGAGIWGAAQRAVARLDAGPSLALTVPAGSAGVRLAVDYGIM